MQRYGSVVQLRDECVEEYTRLHAAVWPEVLDMIESCNLRKYSIYLHKLDDAGHFLFSHFEYVGDDFDADMARMAADPTIQKWWAVCKPLHRPLHNRAEGEWWANMTEVFHQD